MSSLPADNAHELQRQMQVVRGALVDDAHRIADSTSALRAGWTALKSQTHLLVGCGLAATAGYLLAPRRRRREPRLSLPPIEIRPQIVSSLTSLAKGAAFDFVLRTALDYVSRRVAATRDYAYDDLSANSPALGTPSAAGESLYQNESAT